MGWISKAQGITLAREKKIDTVVATSRAGHLFLRTRPGTPVEGQLDHLRGNEDRAVFADF